MFSIILNDLLCQIILKYYCQHHIDIFSVWEYCANTVLELKIGYNTNYWPSPPVYLCSILLDSFNLPGSHQYCQHSMLNTRKHPITTTHQHPYCLLRMIKFSMHTRLYVMGGHLFPSQGRIEPEF